MLRACSSSVIAFDGRSRVLVYFGYEVVMGWEPGGKDVQQSIDWF